MLASPINPSDLMTVRGIYGRRPTLPATPGYEGVGIVDAAGPGFFRHLRGLRPGRRVAVINGLGGNWQEYVVVPATQLVPLPHDLPDEQAASFFVNPASAYVMTRLLLRVPRGEWLLQTAAGGALGRMVVRLGQRFGFRTINVVRRPEQAKELSAMGADAVVCTANESIEERTATLTGGAGVRYALDSVGGSTAAAVMRSLGPGGRLVIYGTLSEEPTPIDPRALIVGQKTVEGFWLSEWAQAQPKLRMLRLFRRLTSLLGEGVLTTEPGASYPLEAVQEAVRQAALPGKPGKVLLRISPAE
jgi:NADPH:quinone reductase-like Zn-dependent oxidoreductase